MVSNYILLQVNLFESIANFLMAKNKTVYLVGCYEMMDVCCMVY